MFSSELIRWRILNLNILATTATITNENMKKKNKIKMIKLYPTTIQELLMFFTDYSALNTLSHRSILLLALLWLTLQNRTHIIKRFSICIRFHINNDQHYAYTPKLIQLCPNNCWNVDFNNSSLRFVLIRQLINMKYILFIYLHLNCHSINIFFYFGMNQPLVSFYCRLLRHKPYLYVHTSTPNFAFVYNFNFN